MVVVDTTCEVVREMKASGPLRAWLKEQCRDDGLCRPGVPADLPDFIKNIAANNENIRKRCGVHSR